MAGKLRQEGCHDFDNAFAGQEGYKLHVPVRHPEEPDFSDQRVTRIYCPYGQVGDRLWVRETAWISDCGKYRCYINKASGDVISDQARYTDRGIHRIYRFSVLSRPDPDKRGYAFKRWFGDVDEDENNIVSRIEAEFHKKQSSIFMPRWASRITLEITGVRVERLQEISDEDCIAEGCKGGYMLKCIPLSPHSHFAMLWNLIHSRDGYHFGRNPWVWVLKFDNIGVRVK